MSDDAKTMATSPPSIASLSIVTAAGSSVASEVSSLDSRTTSSTLRRASSRYSGDPWDEDRERSPSCAPKAWGGFCGCVQTFLVERIDFEDVFIRNAFRLYREEALRNDSMARQWLGMYVAMQGKGREREEKRG